MITDFNAPILPSNISPIEARGGKRRNKAGRALGSRVKRTRKHKKTNKSRTRRYH